MINQQQIIFLIKKLAIENPNIDVVWLYGSRAKGNADENSDYDLAVAYSSAHDISDNNGYRSDDLAFKWTQIARVNVSVIDINHVPTPLAYSVISEGKVIFCRHALRLHSEESRIWSMWEDYRYEYARNSQSFEPYVYAIFEQVEQHISGLDELSDVSIRKPLTFNERSAVERSLQVIVEAAIGCSKHFLKSKNKPVPSEARASIERVYEILSISDPAINDMRGAVGMRNAIIHDYLNLDWKKIEIVLSDKKYLLVKKYIEAVSAELRSLMRDNEIK